ncbi:heme-dependent oxidative N-demethylase family protein [Neorhizobium petrolearium]|uniref:heme-dependent oxidative N-demethylase family protein n=1 Tax=Neorhizobium petrolearium TaxID=515361 RepID=UPI003F15B7F0
MNDKTLTYTPYDGSSKPFTIGLLQLDPARWIEPDGDLAYHLAEKRRLFAEHGGQVFRAEPGTEEAQQEILDALVDYLPSHHPAIYRRAGNMMEMAGQRVGLSDDALPPLLRAGLLVQDDLVVMRKGEKGWRLAAAFLAFPSSWSLSEKFGKVMDEIHAPVPDFEGGSRNAGLISRMFDNLPPDRYVVRWNWSVNWGYRLYRPASQPASETKDIPPEEAFIRVERQTLRKMPVSGDILFTIRIYLDPVTAIMGQPNAPELAASLADQLEALNPAQTNYKGLSAKRAELVALLRKSADACVTIE